MPSALDQFSGTTCNYSQEMNSPYTERSIEVKELNFLGKISTKHCIGNVRTPFTSVSSPSIYSNLFCKIYYRGGKSTFFYSNMEIQQNSAFVTLSEYHLRKQQPFALQNWSAGTCQETSDYFKPL